MSENLTATTTMTMEMSTTTTTTAVPDLDLRAKSNDEFMLWDSHNIFIVVFLIVIVVGLSCGLLGFICTRIIEDYSDNLNRPISQLKKFKLRKTGTTGTNTNTNGNHIQPPLTPTRIIVTRPASDTGMDFFPNETDDPNLPVQTVVPKRHRRHSQSRGQRSVLKHQISVRSNGSSNCEETNFSYDNSPAETPKEKKVFYWSKSNSFDFSNQDQDGNPIQKPNREKEKERKPKRTKHGNSPRHLSNSPLGVFHTVTSRAYSAPLRRSLSDKSLHI